MQKLRVVVFVTEKQVMSNKKMHQSIVKKFVIPFLLAKMTISNKISEHSIQNSNTLAPPMS